MIIHAETKSDGCHRPRQLAGHRPGIQYPRVPSHEIAGVVDAAGAGVTGWVPGQRVGVAGYGGHCIACRRGEFVNCQFLPIPGITLDGGYEEYRVASADALALMPDGISASEAAPLLCAGITTFNALRHSGARPCDLVAILKVWADWATCEFSLPISLDIKWWRSALGQTTPPWHTNQARTHLSLEKDAAESRPVQPPELGSVVELPVVGGLHHRYERRAA